MSSGVYNKTFGDVCRQALRDAGIVAAELPINATRFANAQVTANDVLAFWQAKGIHLWSETEALLPLNPNQSEYSLGAGGAHCFTNYAYTTLTASATATQTLLAVGSTTGMTTGDFIGIRLDDGTRQWTTLTVTSSTQITLATGLTSTSSAGASIYTYTSKIDRPLRVLDARFATSYTNDELIINQQSRQRYYQTPNKTNASATVSNWYYSPQLSNGKILIWPPVSDAESIIRFTFVKPQYVNSDQTEQVLIPSEWYLPLKWAIAHQLAVTYGIDPNRLITIAQQAQETLEQALSNDVEIEYFSIQPG